MRKMMMWAALFTGMAIQAHAQTAWKVAPAPLVTRWAKEVSPQKALPDYPRPQMVRSRWQSLNGLWDFAVTDPADPAPATYDHKILVPYPVESALSGVRRADVYNKKVWYHRIFTTSAAWRGQRVLLHFGAVNWQSAVTVNGKPVAAHTGGYDGFSVDITDALKPGGVNDIAVAVTNPLLPEQVAGKQRKRSESIFYTAATGIWQTVWLEPVATAHIDHLIITPDVDKKALRVTVEASGAAPGTPVQVTALAGGRVVASGSGVAGGQVRLPIARPHLWSPADPYLYDLKVVLGPQALPTDSVTSYAALRKISLGRDAQGRNRLFLNNRYVFQVGLLDQGYWPDGIYTAPTDAALRYDIDAAKRLGFNMLRKHAKVEPERWYYWADRLGILVWQDMPQAWTDRPADGGKQFEAELRSLIAGRRNHPSIIIWTTFNEGWGQRNTEAIAALVKALDPSRLVDSASGWNDKKVGDMIDTHNYGIPSSSPTEQTRASVLGESGGITMSVPGHMWGGATFGYGKTIADNAVLTRRYQKHLRKSYEINQTIGTSAMVYTQLTDVEQELNGLLTYDRALIKGDAAALAAANRGVFPPVVADPLPTAAEVPSLWQYTFDTPAGNWQTADYAPTGWREGLSGFGSPGSGPVKTPWLTPDIWLRRVVTLPALPARLGLTVFHDENVEIYINGVLAATATGYTNDYETLALTPQGRAALKPGRNVLAVHCHQTVGGQFIDLGIIRLDTAPASPTR